MGEASAQGNFVSVDRDDYRTAVVLDDGDMGACVKSHLVEALGSESTCLNRVDPSPITAL